MKDWVSAADAARMAGVTRQHMHNMATAAHAVGKSFCGASNFSGFLAFRRSDVESWIAARREKQERVKEKSLLG